MRGKRKKRKILYVPAIASKLSDVGVVSSKLIA